MATPTYAYPTSAEITEIDPILMQKMTADDPLIGPKGLFPIEETDFDRIVFEQRDNYNGLMQFRGLNGEPPKVKRLGSKRYEMVPGAYGEYSEVDEAEMTRRAAPGTWHIPVDVKDLINQEQNLLMQRQTNLMRWICSQLLTTGTFVVLDKDGAIGAQDSFKQQVYSAVVSWATLATSRPFFDLRQPPILGRGQSTNFGSVGQAWMTQVAFNNMISSQNVNDLRGERIDGGSTVENLADVNRLLMRNNLPQIVIYEEGYQDSTGTWRTFLSDTQVVIVGRRANGQPLGKFRLTRNLASPTGKGVYDKVVEEGMGPNEAPPPRIGIHRGFNGGPILFYPGSIFVLNI